eukprot:6356046-Pyramimonas_sp.AAC.1
MACAPQGRRRAKNQQRGRFPALSLHRMGVPLEMQTDAVVARPAAEVWRPPTARPPPPRLPLAPGAPWATADTARP